MESECKPHYRYCAVPKCKSTTKTAPDKKFFCMPRDASIRQKWCKAMRRDTVSPKSSLYCCEDHFNVKEDTQNYIQYVTMAMKGIRVVLRLKEGVLPHKFGYQRKKKPTHKEDTCQKQMTNIRKIQIQKRVLQKSHSQQQFSVNKDFDAQNSLSQQRLCHAAIQESQRQRRALELLESQSQRRALELQESQSQNQVSTHLSQYVSLYSLGSKPVSDVMNSQISVLEPTQEILPDARIQEIKVEDAIREEVNTRTGRRSNTPTLAGSDGKWPRRLPKAERYKTYKQYSEEDLRKCLEAVRSEEMTSTEASEKFNIPKNTIYAKIKIDPKGQFNDPYKTVNKEKMHQLIQEVKTILTYTNATPFKSKANKYYCAYCSTDGPHFDDPDELRTHTRIQHASDRTARIEYCMRPHWMNETIKLDIENLLCTVCSNSISSWNDMFRHLKDFHKIVLDQAYTRAIPYALRADLHCALCKEAFGNYMHLDGHMNAHYSNHVCDDCGDTFLAANRLKQHRKIHNIGKFACSICPKVFTLDRYKKKHEELVHKHLCEYKCWYCDEKFTAEYIRHVHTVDKHKEKVKTLTCEFCGETFTRRPYYVAHKKKKHIVDV